jgi:hypothetical protein
VKSFCQAHLKIDIFNTWHASRFLLDNAPEFPECRRENDLSLLIDNKSDFPASISTKILVTQNNIPLPSSKLANPNLSSLPTGLTREDYQE